MKSLLITQALWSLLALLLAGKLASTTFYAGAMLAAFAATLYAWIAISLYRGARWAWWLSLAVSLAVLFPTVPLVFYNIFMFLSGNEIFQDSPGTLLVLLVFSATTLMPAFAVLCLLLLARRRPAP